MIGRPFKILIETFCVMVKTNPHQNGGPGLTGLARRRRERGTQAETQRQRDRETETQTETQRETERHREKEEEEKGRVNNNNKIVYSGHLHYPQESSRTKLNVTY